MENAVRAEMFEKENSISSPLQLLACTEGSWKSNANKIICNLIFIRFPIRSITLRISGAALLRLAASACYVYHLELTCVLIFGA
jgi:hypothetical protein